MSLLDMKCQESISCLEDCCYINKEKEVLKLGHDNCLNYIIYLYFNLLPYTYLKYLKQARLILFKLPVKYDEIQSKYKNQSSNYSIYPLLDFFSPYSCMFSAPEIDCSLLVNFEDNECCSYVDIDITYIVKAWIDEEIENKGLLLAGNKDTRIITYASDRHDIIGIHPKLRLIYEENYICQPLSMTPCMVDVNNYLD